MNFKDLIPGQGQWSTISATRAIFMGILSKWYFIIAVPAVSITYKIYKKLEEKGIIDAFFAELQKDLIMIEFMVDKCMDYILEIEKFYNCLGSF